ncbi:MAG: tetratricopeptide repeat protein [Prolixibacteraceae bacterium]|jgi:tetratricopeptide (TPR) repeat protein|nr:tetratricopeptide repeat protein [Prolixibacteraceae bacterium]
MKRILSVLVMFLFFVSAFAQDLSDGLVAKNAGNDAYRSKDYVSAIKNWEKYLASDEEGAEVDENTKSLYNKSFKYAANAFMKKKNYQNAYDYFQLFIDKNAEAAKDGKVAYTLSYCATKLKNYDDALSLYQKAIVNGYKEDVSMLYVANIYKKAGDEDKMKATLIDALAKYPTSKSKGKMAAMLTIPMLQEAAIPFNEANELAKAASSNEPTAYLTNMAKAVAKFETAIPLFQEVLKYDTTNDQAKNYIKNCEDNIKSYNDYKASLEKK